MSTLASKLQIATIEALAGFSSVKVGCQILGWIGASVIGRHFKRDVPILCIHGEPKSGKSALQHLLQYDTIHPDLGYRLSYEARQALLKRSPGVAYAFASEDEQPQVFNIKLTLPFCQYQRILNREQVLSLLEWLAPQAEKFSAGAMFEAKSPKEEMEQSIIDGYKFMTTVVRRAGDLNLKFEMDRHFYLINSKLKETK